MTTPPLDGFVRIEAEGPREIWRRDRDRRYIARCRDCNGHHGTDIRVDAEDWLDLHTC